MSSNFKFNSKVEFKKAINKFFKLAGDPSYTPRPKTYNANFVNGDTKAIEVISYLASVKAPMSRLAYISIGGADGSDVIKVLQNTDINHGLLIEYDSEFCDKAKKEGSYLMPNKKLHVIEGDAFSNRKKVNVLLLQLLKDKVIDGVIITGFSVFHELPDRTTTQGYNLRSLITQMIEGIKHVYFYSKEPCDFVEWKGRVDISFPEWMSTNTFFRFCKTVQSKLAINHSQEFNEDIIELNNSVEMNSKLATEVVKKIVYFLMDGDTDKLIYELQESHSKFSSEKFSKDINEILSSNNKHYESDIFTRNETTNTFRRLYLESGIKIKSVNDNFIDSIVPAGFVTVTAFYRPSKSTKEEGDYTFSNANSEKDAVYNFFNAIELKQFGFAFRYLNSNLRKNRWNNDVNRFIDGYHNLVYSKLVSISPVKNNMGKGWLVYLQAEVDAYIFEEKINIEDIVRRGIANFDINIVTNRIDGAKQMVKDLDGDLARFDAIPFFRFLHPNFLDDVRWITGISIQKMRTRFQTQRILIHSCYNVFCQEENGYWFITKLSPINFNGFPLK